MNKEDWGREACPFSRSIDDYPDWGQREKCVAREKVGGHDSVSTVSERMYGRGGRGGVFEMDSFWGARITKVDLLQVGREGSRVRSLIQKVALQRIHSSGRGKRFLASFKKAEESRRGGEPLKRISEIAPAQRGSKILTTYTQERGGHSE